MTIAVLSYFAFSLAGLTLVVLRLGLALACLGDDSGGLYFESAGAPLAHKFEKAALPDAIDLFKLAP